MLRNKIKIKNEQQGTMLIMALVFVMLFTTVAVGLSTMVASQHKLGLKKINWARALSAAEAGINYYRWHLAHAPKDYQDGTGTTGPYVHEYKDNLGNIIGYFSLNITPPTECSSNLIIESTGWVIDDPKITRVIKVKYGMTSLAQFAFLTNSNAWFGDTENLHGPLHSNGGIRLDGYNTGKTTSAKKTYICGPEHGCSNKTKDGVWGNGGNKALWEFPVSNVDFDAITTDLATLKTSAQNSMCSATEDCYWPQQGLGWHIKFINDGTFNIYRVTRLKNPVWSYDMSNWIRDSIDIDREVYVGNYNIPASCGIIFVEDNLWVDGTIDGSVTVVAAKLPDSGSNPKIIINGNLTYKAKDGTNSLGLISQSDILIPLYAAPNDLEINGALLAQKGHVMRRYYTSSGWWRRVPWYIRDHVLRNSLNLYGAIMTNLVWTWSWVDSNGNTVSGYKNTQTTYDPNLNYNPPPGFPTTGEYQFLRWEEVTEK